MGVPLRHVDGGVPEELADLRGKVHFLLSDRIGSDPDDINSFLKGRDPSKMTVEALKKLQGDLAAL